MKRALLAFGVVVALTATSDAWATPPQIVATCVGERSCDGWFTSDVHLRWDITGGVAKLGCDETWIRDDTGPDGRRFDCTAEQQIAPNDAATSFVTIFRDTTPPSVTDAVADRPPDHAGWYTHPVTFTPQGADGGSGVLGCESVTYAGPDNADARILASCSDYAGLAASRTFPLRYDATAPDMSRVSVRTGDRVVRLSWSPGATATLVRTPGTDGAASAVLYEGPGRSFTDREVRNGRQYRYVLTLGDAAGNTASRELAAEPDPRLLAPARRAAVAGPPLLRWTPVRGARYYNVQLLRNGRKILSAWPKRAELQLKPAWSYRGRRYRLKPGEYRWYVWPGKGPRKKNEYGRRIGARSFVVARP